MIGFVLAQVINVTTACPAASSPPVACSGSTGRCYVDTDDFHIYVCANGAWTPQITSPTAGPVTFTGPTAARSYGIRDANDTIITAGANNTFTGTNSLNGNTIVAANMAFSTIAGTWPVFTISTARTPDQLVLLAGTTSNSYAVAEFADAGYDANNGACGVSSCVNPQFWITDKDQNTTDYRSLGVSGLTGKFVKTLTAGAATSVVIIPVAANSSVSGELLYTVHAKDATNTQTRSGRVIYNGVAEGTTATCVIGTPEELDNTPTGTLTAAITCTSPANNQIQILINAVSDLTETTLEAYGSLNHVGAGEPLPQ